jgi:hypothetical protein
MNQQRAFYGQEMVVVVKVNHTFMQKLPVASFIILTLLFYRVGKRGGKLNRPV